MKFDKQPTSIDEQIDLLRSRGMTWDDEAYARRWRETVGYYRLSAYWLPSEQPARNDQTRSKTFKPGTSFEEITEIYRFDRRLRLLVMEAIECIEVSVRSRWTNRLAVAKGGHAHVDASLFSSGWEHARQFSKVSGQVEDSNEVFVRHYRRKYNTPFIPPLWAVTELMSFGQLSKWVKLTSDPSILSGLATDIGLPTKETLTGTLEHLVDVRNHCAHHSRLWNRKLVKRLPNIKRYREDLVFDPEAAATQRQLSNEIYNTLAVLMHLMRTQPHATDFPTRLVEQITSVSNDKRLAMGFPLDWRERPVWYTVPLTPASRPLGA